MTTQGEKALWAGALLAGACMQQPAHADAVTDWNIVAGDILGEARMGTPPANRAMAIIHTAVYEATNGITQRYPNPGAAVRGTAPGASPEAAIAAANRITLLKLAPSQQAAIDSAYQAALAKLGDEAAKSAGVAVGERAAAAVLATSALDGAAGAESYRPHASAGQYVPTAMPAAPQWPQRKPWLMQSPAQFRPGPPPALSSDVWARDFNETKTLGAKAGSRRTPEQTAIASFWDYSAPPIYHGVVRSVARQPGRDLTQNARLFAAVTQAVDDATVAVFDAKYHYNFWRPLTAIRNGDVDGNEATERDAAWLPFIDTPMHPEYPCAHCTLSGAVGAVLQAELGSGPVPTLSTASPTSSPSKGATRSWSSVSEFMQEVALARIYDGVHYRNSTVVGTALGQRVGELAVARFLRQP
jgi:hypothetical protein